VNDHGTPDEPPPPVRHSRLAIRITVRGDRRLSYQLAQRLAKGGIGQLFALAALTLLPFLGRAYLSTGAFAFWTLLVTIASATVVLDFGGTPLIQASYGAVRSLGRLFVVGCALSAAGAFGMGLLALGAWAAYASTQSAVSFSAGARQILVVTAAGIIRSCVVCVAAAAIAGDRFHLRTALLAGQAVSQVALTWLLLHLGDGVGAFANGMLLSASLTLLLSLPSLGRMLSRYRGGVQTGVLAPGERLRSFMGLRTAAILLGALLTQADRWAVGAIGGASLLAKYEIAYRIATAPKLIVLAVGIGLTSDVARLPTAHAVMTLYRRSLRVCVAFLLVASILVIPVALYLSTLVRHVSPTDLLPLVVLLCAVHDLNGSTAPGTYIALGLRRPGWELPYLSLSVAIVCAGWVLAAALRSGAVAVGAPVFALSIGSVYFLHYFPRRAQASHLA
jgi:O-antigen/teichoic acid export membrane protein